MRTLAILPVKSFSRAKERLRRSLSPELRRELAEAMFTDVLSALGRSDEIDEILVVSADGRALPIARDHRARVIEDSELGHNAAAALGIQMAVRLGADRALLVPGDCPALDPDELDALLTCPAEPPSVRVVPDRHGTGTNALLLAPPAVIEPAFGPGSCRRHVALARAAGVEAEVVEVPTLAVDVDTPHDLDTLEALAAGASGAAVRTRALLSELSKC
jgi:2-phospho-L-lactate guanylyltransferase